MSLLELLKTLNIKVFAHTELKELFCKDAHVTGVLTNKGTLEFDELVIATGYFSQRVFKKLGINAKVQSGKGYSYDRYSLSALKKPVILVDDRAAITPFGKFTRFAGAMEIGGVQGVKKMRKVEGMVRSINKFFPEIDLSMPDTDQVWTGLKPCSADGLPYIGRISKLKNVIVATGHSMMGVSLAPATAKIVEELVSEKKLSFDIHAFSPER